MNILLADDSPVMRKIYRTALEGLQPGPTSFVEAEHGNDAVARLSQGAPIDLIVADWDLPGLVGAAFLGRVRAVRNIPVLFCINKDQSEAAAALPSGPVDVIQRPFADDDLRKKVRDLEDSFRGVKREESAEVPQPPASPAPVEMELPFFLQLPSRIMEEFITLAVGARHAAGATIFHRGSRVESLHVLTSGEAELVDGTGRRVQTCREGDCVGEVPFLMNQPAPNAARAKSDVQMVSLSKVRLSELVRHQPRMEEFLANLMTRHTKRLAGSPVTRIASDFQGSLASMPFSDVIQVLVAAQKTGVLGLKEGAWSGALYLENGEVVHAWTDQWTGDEAFYRMAARTRARFAFNAVSRKEPRTIQQPTMTLLMEAMRRVDEQARRQPGA